MAKILVTGLRAPGSLEWVRALSKEHTVYGLDFMNFPISRFSNGLSSYKKISAPNTENFEKEFKEYLTQENFDLVIPTCEEIFHIFPLANNILAPKELYSLHSKLNFNNMGFDGWSGKMPKTTVKSAEAIKKLHYTEGYVYKPEYTRFGTEVYVKPKKGSFVDNHSHENWLEQDYIHGEEICTYILAHEGKVINHSFYIPKHRSGKAGIYFEWIKDDALLNTIKEFVEHYHIHGQVSFDVIKKKDSYYFLECNPQIGRGHV